MYVLNVTTRFKLFFQNHENLLRQRGRYNTGFLGKIRCKTMDSGAPGGTGGEAILGDREVQEDSSGPLGIGSSLPKSKCSSTQWWGRRGRRLLWVYSLALCTMLVRLFSWR
jgi:hypothetical protein